MIDAGVLRVIGNKNGLSLRSKAFLLPLSSNGTQHAQIAAIAIPTKLV